MDRRSACIIALLAATLATSCRVTAADATIESLARHLQSPRDEERTATFHVLAAVGTADAAILVLQVLEANQRTSLDAKELEGLFAKLPDELLLKHFTSGNAEIAALASKAIEHWDAKKVVSAMEPRLNSTDTKVRDQATRVVVNAMFDGSPEFGKLIPILLKNPNVQLRSNVIEGIFWCGLLTPAMAKEFQNDAKPEMRASIVHAMGRLSENNSTIPASRKNEFGWQIELVQALSSDSDAQVREQVVKTITNYGHVGEIFSDIATTIAVEGLSDRDPRVRLAAIESFQSRPNAEVLETLAKLTADPSGGISHAAFQVLETARYPQLADLAFAASSSPSQSAQLEGMRLLEKLGDKRLAGVAQKLSNDATIRIDAMNARLLPESGFVVKEINKQDWLKLRYDEQYLYVKRLGYLDSDQRHEQLNRLYKELDDEQRVSLLSHPSATEAIDFICERLKDPNPRVRLKALRILTEREDQSQPAGIVEAFELLKDPEREVAKAATQKLAHEPYRYVILKTRATLQNSPNQELMTYIGRSFPFNGAAAREFLLNSLLHEQDLRRIAIYWEKYIGAWDDSELRKAALNRLEQFLYLPAGMPTTPEAIEDVCAALAKAPPARALKLLPIIARIDDDRAVQALREKVKSPDRAIRWAALGALVAHGDTSNEVIDHALARLLTAKKEDWNTVRDDSMQLNWPPPVPAVLARLQTFTGLVDPAAIAELRTELERRMKAIEAAGGSSP
jgi:HEAT repeat protein